MREERGIGELSQNEKKKAALKNKHSTLYYHIWVKLYMDMINDVLKWF